jgi:hypothetical protein
MDNHATVTLAAEPNWPDNDDARFFRREVDTLAPFERPHETWRGFENTGPNSFTMPWLEYDDNGYRLLQFLYFRPPYDWTTDPRRRHQEQLLNELAQGKISATVAWTTRQLWQLIFAVARADRLNEGVLASHSLALTIIANGIRDRLLVARERELQGGHPAWITAE